MPSPLVMNNGLLFPLTPHAHEQIQKRGLSLADIATALLFGRTEPAKGNRFCKVLGREEVRNCPFRNKLRHLIGLTLVVSKSGSVITAYIDRRRRKQPKTSQPASNPPT